jgi:hypothetical protein
MANIWRIISNVLSQGSNQNYHVKIGIPLRSLPSNARVGFKERACLCFLNMALNIVTLCYGIK